MSNTLPEPAVILLADNIPSTRALLLLINDWDFMPVVGETVPLVLAQLAGRSADVVAIVNDLDNDNGIEDSATLTVAMGRPIPTIFTTRRFSIELDRRVEASGSVVLAKPFDPEDLRRALKNVVSRSENLQ